jgi:hypothetical protein
MRPIAFVSSRPAAWLLLSLLVWGCRKQSATPPDVVRDRVERGPLRLTVEASPRQVRVGDPVNVNLMVETPDEYEVRFPEAEDFGEPGAMATRRVAMPPAASPEPRPSATGLAWRRTFTIEPLVSGTLEIPSLVVKVGRRPTGPETRPAFDQELVSAPLKLEVISALTAGDRPERPRDITGTLLPSRSPMPAWKRGLILATAVASLAGAYAAYRAVRRRARRPPPPVLPEVWALRALAELGTYDWLEPARVREYYYRLTEIVRRYIEMKFGLAAPEMTTEEFLRALARDRQALPYDAGRLGQFLEACDFVKYAALHPRREDAESALSTARAFVHATAAATAPVPGGQAA